MNEILFSLEEFSVKQVSNILFLKRKQYQIEDYY